MKDAKGHGSNKRGTHATGVAQIGQPVKISPTVLAKIKANPSGFSLRPNGQAPRSGYMVALPGHTQIVTESDLNGPNAHEVLRQYGMNHADVLSAKGAHIGGWTDKATGKTYLDVSHNFRNREAAIKAGKARNQIAIYDVKRNKDIRTGGTGE